MLTHGSSFSKKRTRPVILAQRAALGKRAAAWHTTVIASTERAEILSVGVASLLIAWQT